MPSTSKEKEERPRSQQSGERGKAAKACADKHFAIEIGGKAMPCLGSGDELLEKGKADGGGSMVLCEVSPPTDKNFAIEIGRKAMPCLGSGDELLEKGKGSMVLCEVSPPTDKNLAIEIGGKAMPCLGLGDELLEKGKADGGSEVSPPTDVDGYSKHDKNCGITISTPLVPCVDCKGEEQGGSSEEIEHGYGNVKVSEVSKHSKTPLVLWSGKFQNNKKGLVRRDVYAFAGDGGMSKPVKVLYSVRGGADVCTKYIDLADMESYTVLFKEVASSVYGQVRDAADVFRFFYSDKKSGAKDLNNLLEDLKGSFKFLGSVGINDMNTELLIEHFQPPYEAQKLEVSCLPFYKLKNRVEFILIFPLDAEPSVGRKMLEKVL